MRPVVAIVAVAAVMGCTSSTEKAVAPAAEVVGVPDSQLGLSKTSVFEVPAPAPTVYAAHEPGENRLLLRMTAEAPPMIPHEVAEFLPITRDANACVDCHAVGTQEPGGAVPLPASHYVDLRNAPDARRDTVAGARYVCTACHAPQAAVHPLVANDPAG
jgi:cytochrome c-type protein NapB